MPIFEAEPFDVGAQRQTEQHWLTVVRDHTPPVGVRGVVRDSWERCLRSNIRPDLPHAPLVLDVDSLEFARARADWLGLARRVVGNEPSAFGGEGHILTLFDGEGRMLSAEGDPRALEGLAEINFRPGGLWSETAAGTNGPGTALAARAPVHIVGAEHFCQRWHPWHCAAVPVRDPATGAIVGVVDISGFREYAHPHTLQLARALVVALEQMLSARELERRSRTLTKLAELATRYPGDPSLAVDRGGRVLCASPSVPAALRAGAALSADLRAAISGFLEQSAAATPRQVQLPLDDDPGRPAIWYPVLDGATPVGGCLVLESRARPPGRVVRPSHQTEPPTVRYSFLDLVGESPELSAATHLARRAAATALPVLLVGESGTGKEILAQAIHGASARRHRPFVAVNCAALPRELVESELFGYVGGAFSGARPEGATGKFEAADGGTLFLDEIVELPSAAQAALLRVLQEGEITRVGSSRRRPVDVRVIAATNRDPGETVATGRLRLDLYHRINVFTIELPPLRSRKGDVPLLVRHFLEETVREIGQGECVLLPEVLQAFERYHWPGNVRELRNAVRRLVATAGPGSIGLGALWEPIRSGQDNGSVNPPAACDVAAPPGPHAELLEAVASARTMVEAAKRLGIARSTLYRRLQRAGLRPEWVLRPG